MTLNKYKLGDLIQLEIERNTDGDLSLDKLKGISIKKVFIETKADMEGVSLLSYLLVKPDCFAYVTVTSRNGEKITLAHNKSSETFIVSSSYIVFSVSRKDLLNSDYLFMFFNRAEFDRYARFNSWGSARETFSWEDMCDIDIELPDIATQQKYVGIYNAMVANQQSYERGLEDLKLVCDGYIEDLRRTMPSEKIGENIELTSLTNNDNTCGVESVRGISIEKQFIKTKAGMSGVNLIPYIVVSSNEFAYAPVTSRNGEKISVALNDSMDDYIISSSYIAFKCKDCNVLYPQYLKMFYTRSDFNRYARFHSWGSARETFDWNEMCDVKIPIPDLKVQKAIADIYRVYQQRKKINEQLKGQIKRICPILIKGLLEDGK